MHFALAAVSCFDFELVDTDVLAVQVTHGFYLPTKLGSKGVRSGVKLPTVFVIL
jgi:hypothetical protein